MKDINERLLKRLPKYARKSSNGAEIDYLDSIRTIDGSHYTIIYKDEESFEEYGFRNFLWCIKTRIQT